MNPSAAWKEAAYGDRQYCFPLVYGSAHNTQWKSTMTIRCDVMRSMNKEYPATMDELTEVLRYMRSAGDAGTAHKLIFNLDAPPYPLHRTYMEWPFLVDEQMRFIFRKDARSSRTSARTCS